MPQALAEALVPCSNCWRVKIHMALGTHAAPAPSRTNLRKSVH